MNRIDTIAINNFKFFRDKTDPIKLGGNNLLLYGENGSGKSSIYWALYTLFEGSIKGKDDDIKKYFSKTIKVKDSLLNIHAKETVAGSDDYNGYVELITDDATPISYKISRTDIAIRTSFAAQFVNYASDFINYRMLLSFSAFNHSDDIDLFSVFIDNILKYVQFDPVVITRAGTRMTFTNGYDIWKQILIGPEWVQSRKSAVPRRILAYKGSAEWIEFNSLVNSFNNSLKKLIDYCNINGPKYFAKLGYKFTYELGYDPTGFVKKEKNYHVIPFSVSIRIPKYESVADAVHKPQSFLNEAKLSAIAISLRLAILSQKINLTALKFIVIDDLLISLDMRNREKVLDLFLSEFCGGYQLIILTHDRMFYQMAKYKIKERSQKNWIYYEMYERTVSSISEPFMRGEVGYLGKAFSFLRMNELEVAANFLRKEAEAFCKELLPNRLSLLPAGGYKNLNGLIVESLAYANDNKLNLALFNNLDKHRGFVLNPSSHDSFDVPKYRNEIEDCHTNLLDLRKILIKQSVPVDAQLTFELTDGSDTYRFEIVVAEGINLIKEPGKQSKLAKAHYNYDVLKNGTKTQPDTQHGIESILSIYDKFYQWSDRTKSPHMWDEVDLTIDGVTQKLSVVKWF